MTTATLTHVDGTAAVSRARVQIPAWGAWWADVDVQSADTALSAGASVTLTIAGTALVGAVVGGGIAYGRGAYRIVGGAGGWRTTVDAAGYRDDAGVPADVVIRDAANAVGETIASPPTTRGGAQYARANAPASRVLHDLAPLAWYIDRDGVTRFGSRSSARYESRATRTARRLSDRVIEIAVDDVAALVPGVLVDTLSAATDVEYELTKARLVARVHGGVAASRDLDAFRRVLDALDPLRAYRALYEYRVVSQDGDALNLQAVRASAAMPDLERVAVRLAAGVSAEHTLGSLVTVAFLDGDPSRPRVVSGDDAGAPGHLPDEASIDANDAVNVGATATVTKLGASAVLGVARTTDAVLAGPWAGTITGGSAVVKAG